MSGRTQTSEIKIKGIQKTNLGPARGDTEPEIFENGVIGGSVSEEFEKAQRFSKLLGIEDK